MKREDDVYGAVLADMLAGKRAMEIVERDDGFVMAFDAHYLVAPFRRWDDPLERRAMRFVCGRVLDVVSRTGFRGDLDLPPSFWSPGSGVRQRCGCGSGGPRTRLG